MELYNKSKRQFTVAHKDGGVQHVAPETTFTVSEEEGKKLLKLYEKDGAIVKLSDAEEMLDESLDENTKLKERIAELEAQVKKANEPKKQTKKAK